MRGLQILVDGLDSVMHLLHKPSSKLTFVFHCMHNYLNGVEKKMFIAQIILCSSLLGQCIGFEDRDKYSVDITDCEKRAEALAEDAGRSIPGLVVARTRCKKLPGFAI